MKIYYSSSSPFVRKVMIVASELGVVDQIERLPSAVHPIRADDRVIQHNPLGQVPSFFTKDGEVLYDSRVICEYLDSVYGEGSIFPSPGPTRWRALREQALADGIMDAGLLVRYEMTVREDSMQSNEWMAGQRRKIADGISAIDPVLPSSGRVDIGCISLACALGYLDFRLPEVGWRAGYPRVASWFDAFAERPSMQSTKPVLPANK